jgi:uncharacterized membrane protein SpoIIM required for sporulation
MNSEVFLKTHRETWNRLNLILDQVAGKGPSSLSQEDLQALGPLFRRVVAHLAYARANYPGHEMINYLNNLVVKAHGHIYKRENLGLRPAWEFFSRGFPRLVREQWRFISIAGLILILGMLTGFSLHYLQPSLDGLIIPDNMKRAISEGLGRGQVGANWSPGERPVLSSVIMTNNIRVGFSSFALGFTWGLATVLVLFYNGLMLGVLGAIYMSQGYALGYWSLILPHGVLELLAIFICGGAGLVLARALVQPGDYTRRDALLVQGRIAVKLVLGTIPMFVAAALIEGFVTPTPLPDSVKLAVAAFSLAVFLLYVLVGNRTGASR